MGNPINYSVELPTRCLTLLEQLWEPVSTIMQPDRPELGPLTSTFLISMSMPIINLPIERIERRRGKEDLYYANDRPIAPHIVEEIERSLGSNPFRDTPFYKAGAWRFVRCTKLPLPNIARGLPQEIATELESDVAAEQAAGLPAAQWCSILRNALAHGGIAYLNSNGRSSYGEPVKMFAFASGKYADVSGVKSKPLIAVNLLRISEEDYFNFLRKWVEWLQNAGIQRAMAA